jgi:hypothetical protein
VLALPGEGRPGRADLARQVLRRLGPGGAPRRRPDQRRAALLAKARGVGRGVIAGGTVQRRLPLSTGDGATP